MELTRVTDCTYGGVCPAGHPILIRSMPLGMQFVRVDGVTITCVTGDSAVLPPPISIGIVLAPELTLDKSNLLELSSESSVAGTNHGWFHCYDCPPSFGGCYLQYIVND